jgi:hypothetical protein
MSFEGRHRAIGLGLGIAAFVAYWVVIAVRAAGDDLPFTEVAWQGPMLVALVVGGAIYGAIYGTMRWRARGTRVADERDTQIALMSETAGGQLTGLAVLVTLIMMALDADPFWSAHVLFVGSFLGSVSSAVVSLSAYRGDLS